MEIKCDICSKGFDTSESLQQHNLAKHSKNSEGLEEKPIRKVNIRKYFILASIILILIFASLSIYAASKKPGAYDDFAKCLTERGAVVYGNDYCQYTAKQLNMFGKSEKYLDYVKCANNKELCDSKGITITPTWEINRSMYEQVQSFQKLSELSGCEIG